MKNYLILYSTTDGHTLKICEKIKRALLKKNCQVTVLSIERAATIALNQFDYFVVGASIRYGKHQKPVYDFIKENNTLLSQKQSAFFSVNLVARKPEKASPLTNPYVKKFLSQIPWKPNTIAIFAGFLDYPNYRFFDKIMIRLIMYITNGPTDTSQAIEFTDWEKVDAFAERLSPNQSQNQSTSTIKP